VLSSKDEETREEDAQLESSYKFLHSMSKEEKEHYATLHAILRNPKFEYSDLNAALDLLKLRSTNVIIRGMKQLGMYWQVSNMKKTCARKPI